MKTRILDVVNLGLKRDGKELLSGIHFSLDSMETLSIIGAKGAGKGLLLKVLLGIHRGEVTGEIKRMVKVGYVSSDYPCIASFSVFQNLSLAAQFAGVYSQTHLAEEIESALKSVDLWTELKTRLHDKVSQLSDFQKLRLDLARTLLLKPGMLLLDKPTMAFDPEKKTHYESLIEKLKQTVSVVWLNHDLEQAARVSDKVLYLKDGRMVEFGSCENIFTMPQSSETENFISRRVHVH